MPIIINRTNERWIIGWPFGGRPAVVGAGNSVVDFLPGRLANIVDEQASCAWLKAKGKRIAETECPDRAIVPARGIVERIVGWDGAVGVDPQYLPEQVGKSLCVCAVGVLAHADVKLSIRSEMETASVVIGGAAKVVEVQDNYFTARCGDIAGRGKSADPIVDRGSGNGVINVDVVVVGEVWIERDPEQAALA